MDSVTAATQADSYFIFHGTGTSSALPLLPCITSEDKVADIRCRSCRACVDPDDSQGWKNVRGNIGGIWRTRGKDGVWRNIVIDVGKTFRQNALKIFREHRIKTVDAVILTHAHADAIAGLDDLRAFTQRPYPGAAKPPPLVVHLSAQTYKAIANQSPYLTDKNKATGGGDVPTLEWCIWGDEMKDQESEEERNGFDVCGVNVVPLKVWHGKYFTPPKKAEPLDIPPASTHATGTPVSLRSHNVSPVPAVVKTAESLQGSVPHTPQSTTSMPLNALSSSHHATDAPSSDPSTGKSNDPKGHSADTPFWCWGFLFDKKVLYLSDISYMPERTWTKIYNLLSAPSNHQERTAMVGNMTAHDRTLDAASPTGHMTPADSHPGIDSDYYPLSKTSPSLPDRLLDVLILDCLRLEPHSSHLSHAQAVAMSTRVRAKETWLVGFTHPDPHRLWEAAGAMVEHGVANQAGNENEDPELSEFMVKLKKCAVKQGLESVWDRARQDWKGKCYPAYDGQVIDLK